MQSKTLTIFIDRPPNKVYAFVSDLSKMPLWAKTFCRSIRKEVGDWVMQTDQGELMIRIAPRNELGILDHYVIPAPGVEIFVPMRVVANGEGSEVVFTLFQQPGMTKDRFAADGEMVRRDLNTLKSVLEQK